MRLAYFTPLPPSKSGIADYNSELLPYLAKGAEISVFVEDADELRENRDRADYSIHYANDFDEIHSSGRPIYASITWAIIPITNTFTTARL